MAIWHIRRLGQIFKVQEHAKVSNVCQLTGRVGQKRAEMMVALVVVTGASGRCLRSGDMACAGMSRMLPFTRLLSATSFSITCECRAQNVS